MFNPKNKTVVSNIDKANNELPDFLNQGKSFSKDSQVAEKEAKMARVEVLRILNSLKIEYIRILK